jgi:hypothetical protein
MPKISDREVLAENTDASNEGNFLREDWNMNKQSNFVSIIFSSARKYEVSTKKRNEMGANG